MTFGAIKAKLAALLGKANETTGGADANLTDAVTRLREGFGKGAVTEGLYATENGSYMPPEGVDGFDQVEVNVYQPPVNSGRLEVSENGEYPPSSYGYDYFDSVYVYVNVEPPYMATPANPEDVRSGREYIDSCGTVQIGSMPENTADGVTIHTDNTKNFSVSIPAGYYPEYVFVSGTVGYSGGNANMQFENSMLSVGSVLFPGQADTMVLPLCLYFWKQTMEYGFGSGNGMFYMPSSIVLAFDSPLVINGAFYAESITLSGSAANQIIFSGSDLTGAYRLNLSIASGGGVNGDVIASMSLTNNGEEVDISAGVAAAVYFVLPFID